MSEPERRRDFLREAASLLACAAFGASPANALALAVRLTAPIRMAGNQAVYPIPAQDEVTIDREHEVILAREQNRVYAFALWCPHQHTALRWQADERRIRCPKHKSTFQPDGTFISGRATRALDRYAIRREGDTVVVDLSAALREDKDSERWGQAVVQL